MTEVGRQPWIVQGYMRTSEAVTQAKGIWFAFGLVLLLYVGDRDRSRCSSSAAMSRRWREGGADPAAETGAPYSPTPASGSGAG